MQGRFRVIVFIFATLICQMAVAETVHLIFPGDKAGLAPTYEGKYRFKGARVQMENRSPIAATVKTRGQDCIRAARKCFSVEPIHANDPAFHLLSLWQDYGYFNYALGLETMEMLGIGTFRHRFVHVVINDQSYGLYLLVENPVDGLRTTKDAQFVGKRSIWPKPLRVQFADSKGQQPVEDLKSAFARMVDHSLKLKGHHKVRYLSTHMDLTAYFDWLTLNSLLLNGDYENDLLLYVSRKRNPAHAYPYFKFAGWDFERLFTAPASMEPLDLLASQHHPLDRSLMRDFEARKALAQRVLIVLDKHLNPAAIRAAFQKVKTEISPYLTPEILAASKLDFERRAPYKAEEIQALLDERLNTTLQRAEELKQRAETILAQSPRQTTQG